MIPRHTLRVLATAALVSLLCAGCHFNKGSTGAHEESSFPTGCATAEGTSEPPAAKPAAAPLRPKAHALLVGVTAYPHLEKRYGLIGPANDVQLMRRLLTAKFGFPEKNIVTLAEQEGEKDPNYFPTRANIEREFARLAQVAEADEQVVIHLAGHGSQQPVDPINPDLEEEDGLDEIFLPRDTKAWDGNTSKVVNAIVDNELQAWLQKIQDKKASIMVIVDACHSGTMLRENEKLRKIPLSGDAQGPGLGIPKAAIQKAVQAAAARQAQKGDEDRGSHSPATSLKVSKAQGLVAIYAAQATEPTLECHLPPSSADAQCYGLLTYTLFQTLHEATGRLTYRELVQRIQDQYTFWNRHAPTPLLEGADADKVVLGLGKLPTRDLRLGRNRDGRLQVNAGHLRGLTHGSVLEVHPPVGQTEDQPLGYVKVVARPRMLEAEVEPCDYLEKKANKKLPLGGRCKVIFLDYSDELRLTVAVARHQEYGKAVPPDRWQELHKELLKLKKDRSPLAILDDPAEADWLVQPRAAGVYLVPGTSTASTELVSENALFGPAPDWGALAPWLEKNLSQIARARNLLKLAATHQPRVNSDFRAQVQVEYKLNGRPFEIWQDSCRLVLHQKDAFRVRVKNLGRGAVDLTLLYVDVSFKIRAWIPTDLEQENRLFSQKTLTAEEEIMSPPFGTEHLVVIAVRAQDGKGMVNFKAMEQDGVTRCQQLLPPSDLSKLFLNGFLGAERTRGFKPRNLEDYDLKVFSWRLVKGKRPR